MSSAHSPNLTLLHLYHSSFSNPSIVSPTSKLILQTFHCFTYVTAHSPTLQLLHLRHTPFSNPSIASHISQLILQPFHYFTYVTAHSPTVLSLHLCHRHFIYVTWRATHSRCITWFNRIQFVRMMQCCCISWSYCYISIS